MTQLEQLTQLADKVLQDPVLTRTLSDRVYALLQAEIRSQTERLGITPRRHP
ncbi:MAG: hypothetical protein AAF282_14105 [Cyanobacteria bacterium P01_A01_bin.15]|mgnify:CR=1 FL=1